MLKKTLCVMALATLVAAPAMAQEKKAEVSVLLGWSFADGVDGQQILAPGNGQFYDRLDPKDSFKWGLMGGALVGENVEVGFMYSQALSKLVAGGTQTTEVGDMKVHNYHGYIGYNWLDPELPARPYFFFGLGATTFGEVDFATINRSGTITSESQFSTTWGVGVKIAPSRPVGARFGIQWTPTYITSEAGGWWCDPWWGCYMVGNAKYANAWDLGGGLSFRF